MDVKINKVDNKFDVILTGRLDTTNADQFQKDIEILMEGENPDITLDCKDMEYTSSQGLSNTSSRTCHRPRHKAHKPPI